MIKVCCDKNKILLYIEEHNSTIVGVLTSSGDVFDEETIKGIIKDSEHVSYDKNTSILETEDGMRYELYKLAELKKEFL